MHMMVAALRADRSDVESYGRILTNVLGDALPDGMVEVDYRRTLSDRMSGKPGQATAVRIYAPDRELELRQGRRGGVEAEVRSVVRGVVISRKQIGVDEWLAVLAEELNNLATRDAAAREALARLFNG
ncbi:hypothetical protein IU500_30230 [Nocardia terpenica]|nr:hypothetical protein [Nocardia terpenica]MBF6108293.1 hypothetical protein [Nocardia terpenica]MBF6115784.1 hypothetical protein [Nocardia terpenica]MBF6122914.1 hypothetical protein [Nocardia terpenica]MBF6156013.1 hypothetical protein [Nocardia terpenica]